MRKSKGRILVIGSLNMDVLVKAENKPKKGQSIIGSHFGLYPGGKGGNQAVQAARLGAEVIMLGRVGNDVFGETLIKNLEDYGVITNYIQRDQNDGTGMGCVFSDHSGDNWIVVVPRANSKWQSNDSKKIDFLVKQSDIVILQMEIPMSTVIKSVSLSFSNGIPVILNPSPAQPIPKETFNKIDTLIPNKNEAEYYLERQIANIDSALKAAKDLCNLGPKRVVLTLGKEGAVYAEANFSSFHPSFNVKAIDSTAAGDAFCGALAYAFLEEYPVDQAMKFASAAGAHCVTKLGAQPSLGSKDDIERILKASEI